jgi:hypothetical protein
MRIRIPSYDLDTRGNRLLKAAVAAGVRTTGHSRLYVQGAYRVTAQIETLLAPRIARSLDPAEAPNGDWSAGWELTGDLPDEVRRLIGLLKEVLTLECAAVIDIALAQDFYNDPVETDGGETVWHRTAAGALVSRAKYWDAESQQVARSEIARRLAEVVRRHPLIAQADVMVSVPGSDTTVWRPSELIARRTAQILEIPFVRTRARHQRRPEAKAAVDGDARFDLRAEFEIDLEPSQRTVLIVDDVVKSGDTMAAVAMAARRAGATTVYGLACARTRRKR